MKQCKVCGIELNKSTISSGNFRYGRKRVLCDLCAKNKHGKSVISKAVEFNVELEVVVCSVCGKKYEYHHVARGSNRRNMCGSCIRKHRIDIKIGAARAIKGGMCQICGYNKCQSALDFHHVDPGAKVLDAQRMKQVSWVKIKEEMKKVVLVCSNCHREIHAGLFDGEILKELQKIMLPSGVDEVLLMKFCNSKETKKFEIPNCGPLGGPKRKFEVSKGKLSELVLVMPLEKVGELYGVTRKAVEKRCKSFDIQWPGSKYWRRLRAEAKRSAEYGKEARFRWQKEQVQKYTGGFSE